MVPEELGFAPIGIGELISVDVRREGRPRRSGDPAGQASPKHRAASSRGNATAADGRGRQCPRRLDGRGGPSVPGYGASDTGAVVAFQDNVLSNSDLLIDRSTTGSNGTFRRGRPRPRRVRRRRPERARVHYHLPRPRPVLLVSTYGPSGSSRLPCSNSRCSHSPTACSLPTAAPTPSSSSQPLSCRLVDQPIDAKRRRRSQTREESVRKRTDASCARPIGAHPRRAVCG